MAETHKTRALTHTTAIAIALGVAAVLYLLSALPPLKTLEAGFSDYLLTQLQREQTASKDIVIVKITEDTLKGFPYRSPLDRDFLAKIIRKILAGGPRSIGVDILIDQPTETEKDSRLLQALEGAQGKTHAAFAGQEDGLDEQQAEFIAKYLPDNAKALVVLAKDNLDAIVRHYLTGRVDGRQMFYSLAHAMTGNRLVPGEQGYRRIRYQSSPVGQAHQFAEYPAHTVEFLPSAWFKDKYVLIGMDLPRTDRYRTPFATVQGERAGTMPGIEIHAHILNQLLSGSLIEETGRLAAFIGNLLFALIGLAMASVRVSVWLRLGMLGLAIAAIAIVAAVVFRLFDLLTPAATWIFAMALSALVTYAMIWQRDRREKRFIRGAWSHYVSANVVDELVANPSKLELGGQRQDISFVFTDIAGFTGLAESMPAEKLAELLNEYLDVVGAEFLRHGATIDKIVGDAVIGFFGAPIGDDDHPNNAVRLAIAVDRACREFSRKRQKEGIAFGRTRVGVHSGPGSRGQFWREQLF